MMLLMRTRAQTTRRISFGMMFVGVASVHCGLDVRGSASEPPGASAPENSVSESSSPRGGASNEAGDARTSRMDAEVASTVDASASTSDGGCTPNGEACDESSECCSGSCDEDNGSLSCQE